MSEGEFEDFDIFGEREKSLGANKDRRNDINDWKSIRKDLPRCDNFGDKTIRERKQDNAGATKCDWNKIRLIADYNF